MRWQKVNAGWFRPSDLLAGSDICDTIIQHCIPDLRPAALVVGSNGLYIELGWISGICGQEE